MAVSDYDLIQAWKQVLTLSKLERGQFVTVLTSASTHPQTLSCALLAATELGAIVNRLDLPPINGEKAISRDALAYFGTTPLTGNHAAIAALKASDLVLDLMTLLFSAGAARDSLVGHQDSACGRTAGSAGAHGSHHGRQETRDGCRREDW